MSDAKKCAEKILASEKNYVDRQIFYLKIFDELAAKSKNLDPYYAVFLDIHKCAASEVLDLQKAQLNILQDPALQEADHIKIIRLNGMTLPSQKAKAAIWDAVRVFSREMEERLSVVAVPSNVDDELLGLYDLFTMIAEPPTDPPSRLWATVKYLAAALSGAAATGVGVYLWSWRVKRKAEALAKAKAESSKKALPAPKNEGEE